MFSAFDRPKALKWLKIYRNEDETDEQVVMKAAKSFQKETGYTHEMMEPIIDFMWKSQMESQH